jgi:hypothetical protein
LAFEGSAADFTGTAFDVSEGDVAVLIGNGVAFTDDAPVLALSQDNDAPPSASENAALHTNALAGQGLPTGSRRSPRE